MLSIVSNNIFGKNILVDDKNEIKHMIKVHRLSIGDKVRVIDYNFEYITQVKEISKNEVLLEILEKNEDKYSLEFNLDFAVGILKNDKMNLVIQKLTEIGVKNIYPLKTERVVVKIDEKKEKWDIIVKESMKQCRAISKTNVELINGIDKINYEKYDIIIYAYENSENTKQLRDIIGKKYKNILCIIGPEGGFSLAEVDYLKSKGAIEISLGNRILRAETAAIVLSGIISNLM